jgi:hypothetical protein
VRITRLSSTTRQCFMRENFPSQALKTPRLACRKI